MSYRVRITILKGLKVILAGGIAWLASFAPILSQLPQTPEVVLLTALILSLDNWRKHRNDGKK